MHASQIIIKIEEKSGSDSRRTSWLESQIVVLSMYHFIQGRFRRKRRVKIKIKLANSDLA